MRLDRSIDLVLRRRWLVVGVALLVVLILASGAPNLTVTNDYRILFSEDNPQLAAFDALGNTYASPNTALIAVAPREGSVFTGEVLGAIEALTEAAWRTPHSIRVDSLTNYTHSEALGEDDLAVGPLVEDAASLSDADLARVESIALQEVGVAGRLVSTDGRVGGLTINFLLPENSDQAVIEITDYINGLLTEARGRHPDISYYLTGDVVMNRVLAEATATDMQTLVPIVFLIIVVSSALLLKSVLATLAILAVVVLVIVGTLGFAGWTGQVFSPASAGVPIIVMAIAVAHAVHIVTSTLAGLREGRGREEAIRKSLRINAWPVFLAALTTTIGFLSLNASDSPPFHVLGNMVAFGLLCIFGCSMTFLPALLSILPLHPPPTPSDRSGFFDRFGAFVVERRKVLLIVVSIVTVVLVAGVPRVELSDNWTRYFDQRYSFRNDTDFVIENLTGLDRLEYSLESGREGGITDPAYLRTADAFAEWYRDQPEVNFVQSFPDVMKRLNKNMHGDAPAFYRIPEDPALAAQNLLLYELSLPLGNDLNDRIDVAKSATRMTVVANASARGLRQLDQRAQEWVRANAPGLTGEASGVTMVFAHLAQRNIQSMLRSTIVAMAMISLILVFTFKSLRFGLASLFPNFVPAAMSFGLWGYLVGQVGLSASVVCAVAFGIVVDDTIHFMSKYLEARRGGASASESVRATFRTVGHALWTTTAVLSASFLVFASSGFQVSSVLGLLVAITLGFALLADFLLLPPLLMAIDRDKS